MIFISGNINIFFHFQAIIKNMQIFLHSNYSLCKNSQIKLNYLNLSITKFGFFFNFKIIYVRKTITLKAPDLQCI